MSPRMTRCGAHGMTRRNLTRNEILSWSFETGLGEDNSNSRIVSDWQAIGSGVIVTQSSAHSAGGTYSLKAENTKTSTSAYYSARTQFTAGNEKKLRISASGYVDRTPFVAAALVLWITDNTHAPLSLNVVSYGNGQTWTGFQNFSYTVPWSNGATVDVHLFLDDPATTSPFFADNITIELVP